jgi:hypothetical protein
MVGGETINLPTLKIADSREWKAKLARAFGGQLAEFNVPGKGGFESMAAMLELGQVTSDVIIDLVADYDAGHALGTREELEAAIDDGQAYTAFRAILRVHFPFVTDLTGAIAELGRLMAAAPRVAASTPPSSPSGASPNGARRRTPSKAGSTSRS